MIQLESTSKRLNAVRLGEILEFRVNKDDPAVEARFFLRHRPIFYTRPLTDWTAESLLRVFPEAPGKYTLAMQWRSAAGDGGWDKLDFNVVTNAVLSPAPAEIKSKEGSHIWVPSEWEAKVFTDTEPATMDLLKTVVTPGSVVYDLGANLGIYSCYLARLVGPTGQLYCVEANPICIQFLRTNLALQEVDNVEILPVAVLDRDGETRFSLNYGNSNLGLSEHSGFYAAKVGHEIKVPCFRLDSLVETFHLPPPQVIKIDIEGVEHLALQGMHEILTNHRPILLMELHGEDCARASLEVLEPYAYQYTDPTTLDELRDKDAVHKRFGSSVFQLLAKPLKSRP